jgi:hypothetical protein
MFGYVEQKRLDRPQKGLDFLKSKFYASENFQVSIIQSIQSNLKIRPVTKPSL